MNGSDNQGNNTLVIEGTVSDTNTSNITLTPSTQESEDLNETFIDPTNPLFEVEETEVETKPVNESPADQFNEEVTTVKIDVKRQNVEQTYPTSRPKDDGAFNISLDLPSNNKEFISKILEDAPNLDVESSEKGSKWLQSLISSNYFTTNEGVFIKTLEDESASFKQVIDVNGVKLIGAVPNLQLGTGQNVEGERAIAGIRRYLKQSTYFQVPLYHSGFWITFKAPGEFDLIELKNMMSLDKINFGRASYGLAYSNTVSYTVSRLVDFALSHVLNTSVNLGENFNHATLKNLISAHDIFSLLHGFITAIYTRGYHYRRPCINNVVCNYVLEETLNVSKLHWVNSNALTEWQKVHMSNRNKNSMTLDNVNKYKSELLKTQTRRVAVNKEDKPIYITLRTPSVNEYITTGYEWVTSIVEMAEKSISDEVPQEMREEFIANCAKASSLRQYQHYIESIDYNLNGDDKDSEIVIKEKDTIKRTLNELSSDDIIRDEIMVEVVKYINDATIAVVGIPTFDCPKCGKPQEEHVYPKHTNIIPLDVIQVFFALIEQSIQRLQIR